MLMKLGEFGVPEHASIPRIMEISSTANANNMSGLDTNEAQWHLNF